MGQREDASKFSKVCKVPEGKIQEFVMISPFYIKFETKSSAECENFRNRF